MPDIIREYSTDRVPTEEIGRTIDEMMKIAKDSRRNFERRWYDNNFFDDGYHFRYLSRSQNKIVDLSEKSTLYTPMRAIPKASRQIRGVANLLVATDPTPVVYPEKVDMTRYPVQQEYQLAQQQAQDVAKKSGQWLEDVFKEQDIVEKLAFMAILTAKHGISFMEIWPDSVEEKIRTQVFDAYDVYMRGDLTELEDCSFVGKGVPKLISEIKANKNFDQNQLRFINPDNKWASSEIKEAYLKARYGGYRNLDKAASLIQNEYFLKEYITEYNIDRIKAQENGDDILKTRKIGDQVIRHVFAAGAIWLLDEYTDLPGYPFVDFRMEPGPLYQVPLIERFIPLNKSFDMMLSRAERYSHNMVTGSWSKRQGEQFEINNTAGGQILEYVNTPPVQNQIASIPPFYFEIMNMMQSLMEEQGVTTTAMGKIPRGVKSNAAIESLKESEVANLVIANRRMNMTVKKIAEKCLDIADKYYITPKTVYYLEKGKPTYFEVIGASAMQRRKKAKIETKGGLVPLKGDYKVDIEIESGMGFTKEGQKAAVNQLIQQMFNFAQAGMINQDALKVVIQRYLEIYQFGSTAEFMENLENAPQQNMSEQQIQQTKVAVMEVMADLIKNGILPSQDQRIQESKVATAEAAKDIGLVDNPKPSEPIPYKDAPEDVKRQMEAKAGFKPSDQTSPAGSDQIVKHTTAMKTLISPIQEPNTQPNQVTAKTKFNPR